VVACLLFWRVISSLIATSTFSLEHMGHGLGTFYVYLMNKIHMTQEGEGDPKKFIFRNERKERGEHCKRRGGHELGHVQILLVFVCSYLPMTWHLYESFFLCICME
jgi:hypothetical protein